MGWGSFTHKVRKIVSPRNMTAALVAPATGGLNLLMTKDNAGNTVLDALRGKTDVDKQNEFNAEQAQLNRDWQEKMSNSAYQRGYTDLMTAGLNPNLAGGSGGASTPGGAQASSAGLPESPASAIGNTASTFASIGSGVSELSNAAKTSAEAKFVPEEKKAEIANTTADTVKKTAEAQNISANTQVQKETAKQMSIDNMTRDELNKAEIEFKKATSQEAKQKAIQTALTNNYNKMFGTNPDQSTVERIASIAYKSLIEAPSTSMQQAIEWAIKKVSE